MRRMGTSQAKMRSGGRRQVERARELLPTVTDPQVAAILRARVDNPDALMQDIAATLGMTRDAYWSRLRRALRGPQDIEREKAHQQAFDRNRIYGSRRGDGPKALYIGTCGRQECGARPWPDGTQRRRFFVGQQPCEHVAARHVEECPARTGQARCDCGGTVDSRASEVASLAEAT